MTRERKTHISSNAESDRKQNYCDHLHRFRAAVPVQTYTQSDNQSTTYFVRIQHCWFQTNLVPLSRISLWYNIRTYVYELEIRTCELHWLQSLSHTHWFWLLHVYPSSWMLERNKYTVSKFINPLLTLYTHTYVRRRAYEKEKNTKKGWPCNRAQLEYWLNVLYYVRRALCSSWAQQRS